MNLCVQYPPELVLARFKLMSCPIPFTEKKSKKKKEKSPDPVSDGISDLLAQMNLQCSSVAPPPPPKPLRTFSIKDDPALVILDTPENHKLQQKTGKDGPRTPGSGVEAAASASPSVSSVIEALHLSDIDWDAASFSSSPQAAANHVTEPRLGQSADGETVKETKSDIRETDFKLSAELSYTECPLRDRVLMRNAARTVDRVEEHNRGISKPQHCELASHKSDAESRSAGPIGDVLAEEPENVAHKVKTDGKKFRFKAKPPGVTKDRHDEPRQPRQRATSVKMNPLPSTVPQQRPRSDPGHSGKTGPQTTKKSVCVNLVSSSEDSDAENRPCRQRKPKNKIKDYFPKTARAAPPTRTAQLDRRVPLQPDVPASPSGEPQQHLSAAAEVDEVFLLHDPASPAPVSLDSDGSVNCSDSPLPLAERLRLKFLP